MVQQGVDAQALLTILQSLLSDDKFRSVKDLQAELDEIQSNMETMEVMREKIPLLRKAEILQPRTRST